MKKIFDLRGNRYQLLVAVDGQDAFDISHDFAGKIDLLVSNVQMPGITGPDLAAKLKESRPDMKIILMSGYSQGLLILDHGWSFIQKPFAPHAILDKIEQILAQPADGDAPRD